ncbi:alpha/beta hydrolase [Gracilibacillus dipsosauri]|uniref:Esterase n=1 Tax=Gracilibacillus dipsosauri TaxID=178340 RepID=A0A317KWF9_9BACI|nr:alpha/beta hydrolase family protein [Gracilibacillus dipsosauri]PWU67524.1 esterase [Gracilibacillus dipsosauri]
MALIQCNFFSEVLSVSTSITVILPQETSNQIGMNNKRNHEKIPTLYLLHGFSDDHTIWTRRTSIERYAAEYGLAVVMPQVDHSFYADMVYGKKYWTFISEELPRVVRSFFPLSDRREDNFVAGLSMGGYGAFKWALRKPGMFSAAASLSGVLDIVEHTNRVQGENNPIRHALDCVFGEKDIKNTEEDLFYLLEKRLKEDQALPALFQACGTEDFLFDENKRFFDFTNAKGVGITHTFTTGNHEWDYWDSKIQEVLAWLPIQK